MGNEYSVYVCFLMVGLFKALSDLSSEGSSVLPQHTHKGKSWINKWSYPLIPNQRPKWMYLWLFVPKYEERFYLSSTWLVNATDWWHKFETGRAFFAVLGVLTYNAYLPIWLDFPVIYLCYISGFTLIYNLKNG